MEHYISCSNCLPLTLIYAFSHWSIVWSLTISWMLDVCQTLPQLGDISNKLLIGQLSLHCPATVVHSIKDCSRSHSYGAMKTSDISQQSSVNTVCKQCASMLYCGNLSSFPDFGFMNKNLSYHRETVLQGALVLAKSGRMGLGDDILRTSLTTVT